jgi:hypothetical protein
MLVAAWEGASFAAPGREAARERIAGRRVPGGAAMAGRKWRSGSGGIKLERER